MFRFMGIGICKGIGPLIKKAYKFFLAVFVTTNAFGLDRLDMATIDEYLKIQKEFFHEMCPAGTEDKYEQLLRDYQGDGNYIPTLLDDKVDFKTIKSLLPLLDEKIIWLKDLILILKSVDNFKQLKNNINEAQAEINFLQQQKKEFSFAMKKKNQDEALSVAKSHFLNLRRLVDEIKKEATFLLSFKFPLNHLALRTEYDKFKDANTKEERNKANMIFFFRKIVQDGSLDEKNLKSDIMLRTSFDTTYISLNRIDRKEEENFLSDSERMDLQYILRSYETLIKSGPSYWEKRLGRFLEKVQRSRNFYGDLVEGKAISVSENTALKDVTDILESRAKSLYNLKDFVLKNEARAYEFWTSKSELFQSLYVFETILYSEVGRLDENVSYYRKDVAQVVFNRQNNLLFNQIKNKDAIYKYLSDKIETKKFSWLNVLFKEGEFSFTYFYVPGNLQIYCPDMTRVGSFLRKDNLKLALELLKKPRLDFPALRYFSRVSMMGRISMDPIWTDYQAIAEAPGVPLKLNKRLIKLLKNDQFKFLYEFKAPDKKTYWVVDLKGNLVVVSKDGPHKIYSYRNPHFFKFFSFKS
jgi:hypothetical protein